MGAKFVSETGEMPYADLNGADVPEDLRILDLDTIWIIWKITVITITLLKSKMTAISAGAVWTFCTRI